MRTHQRVGVTVLLLTACAAIVVLSPSGSNEKTTVSTNASYAPGTNGMRVYMDPETGEVTSTPPADAVLELDAALENTLRHDDEGLVTEKHPNGSSSLNLQGRYGDVVMIRVDENGKAMMCSGDETTVAKTLNDNTTPTGPAVK